MGDRLARSTPPIRGENLAFEALAVIIGFVVGWIKKGSLLQLSSLRTTAVWLLPIAYVSQALSIHLRNALIYEILISVSYLLLLSFCVINTSLPGVKWAGVGTFLNFLEMACNGLRMPAYVPAVRMVEPGALSLLKTGHAGKSVAMDPHTIMPFLGDIIPIRLPFPSVVSIGDCLFSIGLVLLIVNLMTSNSGDVINA